MKLNYLLYSYAVLALITCICFLQGIVYVSIGVRFVAYFVLCLAYYQHQKKTCLLWFIAIFFAWIGENLMLFGIEKYQDPVNYSFIIYAWLLIFLLRNNDLDKKHKIPGKFIIPLVISSALIMYSGVEVLHLIYDRIQEELVSTFSLLISFIVLTTYMGVLYVSRHTHRYFWLLFFLLILVIQTIYGSIVIWYFPQNIFKTIIIAIQMTSHFLLFKFLISKDEKIEYIQE